MKNKEQIPALTEAEEKGILKNDGGIVVPVVSRELFMASQSRQYVERSFGGSLPRFLAAFIEFDRCLRRAVPVNTRKRIRNVLEHEYQKK